MPAALEGLALVLLVAAVAAVVGAGFGIFVLAPRIARMLDRTDQEDEDSGDRDH
jgi:hypothetical protein